MMEIKVSIVVPCYNGEEYIRECLDSIYSQSLKEIEVIMIDDGSTDRTAEIMAEYAAADSRFQLVSKANTGYGHSINLGFSMAKGKYVGIVESDDYVLPQMFEALYTKAEENDLDLIKSDYDRFEGTGADKKDTYLRLCPNNQWYDRVIDPSSDPVYLEAFLLNQTGIYKKEYLDRFGIRFNETPGASYQDNGFWFQNFCLAQRAFFLSEAFYMLRRDNPNSSIFNRAKVFCICDEYDFIYKFLEARPEIMRRFIYRYYVPLFKYYLFALNRVANEYKLDFVRRFSSDLSRGAENGHLRPELFSEDDWNTISSIIIDPENYLLNEYVEKSVIFLPDNTGNVAAQTRMHRKRPEKPLVSVIIPIYNAVPYLRQCLDSILDQTLSKIEIICVDDGSTDRSSHVIEEYAKKDNRIYALTQKNSGVSAARNAGIDVAKGAFLCFIDSDDFIAPDMLKALYDAATAQKVQIAVCGGKSQPVTPWADASLNTRNAVYRGKDVKLALFHEAGSRPFIFNKLFNRSFIETHKLRFDTDTRIGEDMIFLFDAFPKAQNAVYIDKKVYLYRQHDTSAMAVVNTDTEIKMTKQMAIAKTILSKWISAGYDAYPALFDWVICLLHDSLIKCRVQAPVANEIMNLIDEYGLSGFSADADALSLEKYDHIRFLAGDKQLAPLASIVMPLCNAEAHLHECIDSIRKQSFWNFELICVDDGATDSSIEILDEYQRLDRRIQIIRQARQNAGAARNEGIARASGKYLICLDSDDFFSRDLLKATIARAEAECADIVIFDADQYTTATEESENDQSILNKNILAGRSCVSARDFSQYLFNFTVEYPWNKLYRLEFVRKHGMEYQSKPRWNDLFFSYVAIAKAENIAIIKDSLVSWRIKPISERQAADVENPMLLCEILDDIKVQLQKDGLYACLEQSFLNMAVENLYRILGSLSSIDLCCELYNALKEKWFVQWATGNRDPYYYFDESIADFVSAVNSCNFDEYLHCVYKEWDESRVAAAARIGKLNKRILTQQRWIKDRDERILALETSWSYRIGNRIIRIPNRIKRFLGRS